MDTLTLTLSPYTGEFPMDFLLEGETVHAAGDGTAAAIVETRHGPVRIDVGRHAERQTDGRVAVR